MDDILRITQDTLSNIFKVIKGSINSAITTAKDHADSKDNAIIAAALNGKHVISYSGTLPAEAKVNGALSHDTTTNKFYYYLDRRLTQITLNHLLLFNKQSPVWANQLIPTNLWSTATPFKVLDGTVTAICKGETANGFIKWTLFMLEDSETQTYTAVKTSNTNYKYGEYSYDPDRYNAPWELWLPSSLTAGSVTVHW